MKNEHCAHLPVVFGHVYQYTHFTKYSFALFIWIHYHVWWSCMNNCISNALITQTPVHYKNNALWTDCLVNMLLFLTHTFHPSTDSTVYTISDIQMPLLFCLAIWIFGFCRGSKLGSSAVEIRPSHENIMMRVKRPMIRRMAAIQ